MEIVSPPPGQTDSGFVQPEESRRRCAIGGQHIRIAGYRDVVGDARPAASGQTPAGLEEIIARGPRPDESDLVARNADLEQNRQLPNPHRVIV